MFDRVLRFFSPLPDLIAAAFIIVGGAILLMFAMFAEVSP